MNIKERIKPVDQVVSKALLVSLSLIVIALGVAIFMSIYLLSTLEVGSTIMGMALVWLGSMVFFYAVITEEHTLKQLFLRQSYFFTGLFVMILGMFFVSLSGLVDTDFLSVMEYGILLVIFGAALILLSLQRTRDYSKRSVFLAFFGGVFLILGGILSQSLNTAYAGVFIIIFSGIWWGLRDRKAV